MRPIFRNFRHILIVVLMFFAIQSCKKKEIYPETPQIEFKSAAFVQDQTGIDSIIILTFTFKDGDGDLGLNQSDTLAPFNAVTDSTGKSLNPFYNNIHFEYEESINGLFKYVTNPFNSFDTLTYAYRFENITPDGRHKAIRGDIEVKVGPNQYPNAADTCRYKFYIYDRALHKSNLAETPSLVWKRR